MTSDVVKSERRGLGFSAHPPALAGLYFTELWERFSYYGMRALLVLFMVAPIEAGGLGFKTPNAGSIYGTYTMAVYLLAVPGGFLADRMLGAKRSVLIGGMTIAAGHYALAIPSLTSFYIGLMLIALGTGLFKPNISALVGALYSRDDVRRDAGFSLFYMGINIGAFLAPLVTGFLAQSPIFKDWLAAAGFDPSTELALGFCGGGHRHDDFDGAVRLQHERTERPRAAALRGRRRRSSVTEFTSLSERWLFSASRFFPTCWALDGCAGCS